MAKGGKNKTAKSSDNTITFNRRATHDYTIEQKYEAGVALEGWEIKSLREGKGQLTESYVLLKKGEAWLIGAHISPLKTASTHIQPDNTRTRKLLLHRKELSVLIGKVEQKGYTLIPLSLYWKNKHIKLSIGLAKGKAKQDKRAATKDKDWQRQKQRLFKKDLHS